jgi:hypothetical protein
MNGWPAKRTLSRREKETVSPQLWAAATFATAALPDKRLSARLVHLAATLAAKPLDSIPKASRNWAEAKGTYRFMENKRTTVDDVLKPIAEASARRSADCSTLIVPQDTTGVAFPKANVAEGLGPVASEPRTTMGLFVHSTLAVREDGLVLGVFDVNAWARQPPDKEADAKKKKSKQPIEEKESWKWMRGIRAARQAIADQLPEGDRPRLIHVMDREGDVYEVLADIVAAGEGAVIRCNQNRRVELADGRIDSAHHAVRASPLLIRRTIDVPRKHKQPKRKATVEIRRCAVRIQPPHDRPKGSPTLALTLVEVWEPEPPEGIEPLHWRLWTAEPAETIDQVNRVVKIYRLRWRVEDYHLVLKSGCQVEALQFETAERLKMMMVIYASIAVRILQLRDWARLEPHTPCTVLLSQLEWRTLWTYIHQEPVPRDRAPPSLRQATLWIGRLGGHLNRKSDGMPGVRTLWQGWRDLLLMTEIYRVTAHH